MPGEMFLNKTSAEMMNSGEQLKKEGKPLEMGNGDLSVDRNLQLGEILAQSINR